MNRFLKNFARGAMLCMTMVLQMAAVPNSTDAPATPAGVGAPIFPLNIECGMCADDGTDEWGFHFHHFDGDCEEVHDFGCQNCESHTEGCHSESITDPENPGVSCGDGTECAYARMAQGLETDIRRALNDGDDAVVMRLMLETKVPFAIDVKASTARLYGCYGLLAAELPISRRLAAELSAEAVRRGDKQK